MPLKKQSPTNFRFVTESYVREYYHQLTRHQFGAIRSRVPKSIYWVQPSGKGGGVLWNLPLLQSYLLNGVDSSETQALIEEYISTLPKAA
jgi:hypothetical protein